MNEAKFGLKSGGKSNHLFLILIADFITATNLLLETIIMMPLSSSWT